jgi:hypothetical protein
MAAKKNWLPARYRPPRDQITHFFLRSGDVLSLRACLKTVASAILADVEPGLPARRDCVATGKTIGRCGRSIIPTVFPGGRMPPSTAGKDACRHMFRQAKETRLEARARN